MRAIGHFRNGKLGAEAGFLEAGFLPSFMQFNHFTEVSMQSISKSVTPAAKNYMEAQMSLFTDLSKKLFDSAQRISELNMQVTQTILEESLKGSHELLCAEDSSDFISIAATQLQPVAEKLRTYHHDFTNIAAGTRVELAKATEQHVPETSRTAAALAEEVARKAHDETEKATQRQKAAIDKMANSAGDSRVQAGRSQQNNPTQGARPN
jgi:phasin family protein